VLSRLLPCALRIGSVSENSNLGNKMSYTAVVGPPLSTRFAAAEAEFSATGILVGGCLGGPGILPATNCLATPRGRESGRAPGGAIA
jgi:hypothetical protein